MIPAKFRFIWISGFRVEYSFKDQPIRKKELSVAPMFAYGSGRHEQSLQRTFQRCFLPSYGLFY